LRDSCRRVPDQSAANPLQGPGKSLGTSAFNHSAGSLVLESIAPDSLDKPGEFLCHEMRYVFEETFPPTSGSMNKPSNHPESQTTDGSNPVTRGASFLIGIAGGSAGGKTTFAGELLSAAGDQLAILELDRFYHPLKATPNQERTNFDHPSALDFDLLEKVLKELQSSGTTSVPNYDFATHNRVGHEDFDAAPIIIVEGILALWNSSIRDMLDLKVYVDAPSDVRLQRRMERDQQERGRDADSIQRQWNDTVQPMHDRYVEPSRGYADQIIDGTANLKNAAADFWTHGSIPTNPEAR